MVNIVTIEVGGRKFMCWCVRSDVVVAGVSPGSQRFKLPPFLLASNSFFFLLFGWLGLFERGSESVMGGEIGSSYVGY